MRVSIGTSRLRNGEHMNGALGALMKGIAIPSRRGMVQMKYKQGGSESELNARFEYVRAEFAIVYCLPKSSGTRCSKGRCVSGMN